MEIGICVVVENEIVMVVKIEIDNLVI